MATIDDVYKVLTGQPPEDAYQYLDVIGPLAYLKQVNGFFWMKEIYDRVGAANNNVNDIESAIAALTVKVNEMHLALVTGDLAGKINQVYASIYTENLADQLETTHEKLDAILSFAESIGTINDDWDTGSETIYAYLNYVFG